MPAFVEQTELCDVIDAQNSCRQCAQCGKLRTVGTMLYCLKFIIEIEPIHL